MASIVDRATKAAQEAEKAAGKVVSGSKKDRKILGGALFVRKGGKAYVLGIRAPRWDA